MEVESTFSEREKSRRKKLEGKGGVSVNQVTQKPVVTEGRDRNNKKVKKIVWCRKHAKTYRENAQLPISIGWGKVVRASVRP